MVCPKQTVGRTFRPQMEKVTRKVSVCIVLSPGEVHPGQRIAKRRRF